MAKQHSLIPITGKVGNSSFFYTRNGGFQMRQLNPTMSERVKTEPNFANTRLQAAEFGAAGSTVSALIRTLMQRYRYILNPKITGDLTQAVYGFIKNDREHEFGQRQLPMHFYGMYQQAVNTYFKRKPLVSLTNYFDNDVQWNGTDDILSFNEKFLVTDEMKDFMERYNCDQIRFTALELSNVISYFDTTEGKYTKGIGLLNPRYIVTGVAKKSDQLETIIWNSQTRTLDRPPLHTNQRVGGVFILQFPEKLIGENYYTLQNLCSAYWYTPEEM